MLNKSLSLIFLILSMLIALSGCDNSDVNNKNSITSGTTTGFGSSGGSVTNVTVTAGNSTIASEATTIITVIITDRNNKRTDDSIILTSSRAGYFNGDSTNTTLNEYTLGGVLVATYTAPSVTSQTDTEITAMVKGTTIKGTTIITITP
jgi:hypothetical protein